MGLHRFYQIEVEPPEQLEAVIAAMAGNFDQDSYFADFLKEQVDYYFQQDDISWFEHDDDMKQLSAMVPDAELILSCREENGAEWEHRYKGGVMVASDCTMEYWESEAKQDAADK